MRQNTFTFVAYAPVIVLYANPKKEVVNVFRIRTIEKMSSFNLFIFSLLFTETEKHYLNNTIFILNLRF